MDKIFITGPVGSGKSTLARKIAERGGLPCRCFDDIVYEPHETEQTRNHKRPEAERDRLLAEMLAKPRWVMEDAGRACFEDAWRQADVVLLLEPPLFIRFSGSGR